MLVTWILGLLFAGGYWANCHNKGQLFTLSSRVGGPRKKINPQRPTKHICDDDPWRKLVALLGVLDALSSTKSSRKKKRSYLVYLKICNSIHEGKPKVSIDWYQPPTPTIKNESTHGFLLISSFIWHPSRCHWLWRPKFDKAFVARFSTNLRADVEGESASFWLQKICSFQVHDGGCWLGRCLLCSFTISSTECPKEM